MIKAASSVLELVGNTPIVKSSSLGNHLKSNLFFKLEYLNPGSSVKDRIAMAMVDDAEKRGVLKPGGTIIEATSGNTGVALAMVAAIKGYKSIFVMPDKMSDEKVRTLQALGAEVILTPTQVAPDDPRSFYKVAEKIAADTPNSFLGDQYFNHSNPQAHYLSTGPEIWAQTDGLIDVLVAGMGTGGTLCGSARYLKEQNPEVQIVAADPVGSIFYDYFKSGKIVEAHSYYVEGFGEDLIPDTVDFSLIDDIIQITDKDCFDTTRRLLKEEGVLAGGSSGGNVAAAIRYAEKHPDAALNIVVIMPDSFSRYLSKIFNDDWMAEHGFL